MALSEEDLAWLVKVGQISDTPAKQDTKKAEDDK